MEVHTGQEKQVSIFWFSDPLKASLVLEEPRLEAGRNQVGNGLDQGWSSQETGGH